MGTAITLSSFTKPRENVYRTCWIVACANSAFSFTGGFAIFYIVGNITYQINWQKVNGNLDPLRAMVTKLKEDGEQAVTKATQALATVAGTDSEKVQGYLNALKGTSFDFLIKESELSGVNKDTLDFDAAANLGATDVTKW